MARKVVTADNAGEKSPAPAVDFKKIATEGAQQRETDLLARAKAAGLENPPEPKTAGEKTIVSEPPEDKLKTILAKDAATWDDKEYDAWFEAQPVKARERFAGNVLSNGFAQVKEKVGEEFYNLVEEGLKDEAFRKQIAKLSNKERRQWIFDTAYSIYDDPKYATEAPANQPPQDPRYDQLAEKQTQIEKRLADEDTAKQRQAYEANRANELGALVKEYPSLAFDVNKPESPQYKLVAELMDYAEYLSSKERRPVSYKEAFQKREHLYAQQPDMPPIVPNTTRPGPPEARQAPKDDKESRQRMKETLEKYGGLTRLARSLGG